MKCRILYAAASVVFSLVGSARADVFDAGTVTFQYYAYGGKFSDTGSGSPNTFATPGSATFFPSDPFFTVTVAGHQITYTYEKHATWTGAAVSLDKDGLFIQNGALITALSGIPAFTSVILDPSSNLGSSGFTAHDVTFNAGNVATQWCSTSTLPPLARSPAPASPGWRRSFARASSPGRAVSCFRDNQEAPARASRF
jgi:hypothetical protein